MTDEQRALLADRIAQPDLAALGEGDAAAALNAPDPANGAKPVDADTATARGVLFGTGEWGVIVWIAETKTVPLPDGSTVPAPPMLAIAAINARDTLLHTGRIEATNPAYLAKVQEMLAGFVAAGVVAQATSEALLALTTAPRAWWEANGFDRPITANDVGVLRAPQQES